MQRIDFVTALGRLLRDGPLRDAFARNALSTSERLGVSIEDRPTLLALDPAELESQAGVLLRKRFEAVSRLIPQTIANTGGLSWPLFAAYSRAFWPTRHPAELHDAQEFCVYLSRCNGSAISSRERNRLRFATGDSHFAVHLVSGEVVRTRRRRPCLQFLVRSGGRRWREMLIYLGL